MAPRLPLLAVALVAACTAPALSKTIEVQMAKDGSSGSCPGSTCNLRAAWDAAMLGDTILLGVNPVMSAAMGPLGTPQQWHRAKMNGTVTLAGPSKVGAVVHGGSRFISIHSYPYSEARQVRLVIKDIEFTGFNYGTSGEAGLPGLIVCLSVDSFCTKPSESAIAQTKAGRGVAPLADREGHLLGDSQTKFGNWSQLRKRTMLDISNCVIRDNVYYAGEGGAHGSMIATKGTNSNFAHPVLITSTQFLNNTVTGYQSSIGTVFGAEASSGATALMISKCRFAQNNQETTSNDRIEAFQGPVIGNLGPISIYGSSFVGNTVGSVRAVVSAGYNPAYHVYIYDSSFVANGGNQQTANSFASLILGGWIVLHRVTAYLPSTTSPVATFSPNDQYLLECGLASEVGKPVSVAGYMMYNRNPLFTNLVNGTAGSSGVFASCAEAADWLPCRAGTTCTPLINTQEGGEYIGYKCV